MKVNMSEIKIAVVVEIVRIILLNGSFIGRFFRSNNITIHLLHCEICILVSDEVNFLLKVHLILSD